MGFFFEKIIAGQMNAIKTHNKKRQGEALAF